MANKANRNNFIYESTFCSSIIYILVTSISILNYAFAQQNHCSNGILTFELLTGQVFTNPSDSGTSTVPGILHLTDCMDICLKNDSCKAVNFETGLCVLLTTVPSEQTVQSQFPVFIIFAQKICLSDTKQVCNRGWAFERVKGFELKKYSKKSVKVMSRLDCMQMCLNEIDFECRSANYDSDSHECSLSDMDRHTITDSTLRSRKYGPSSGTTDYMENNCIQEPKKLCDFKPISGKILKTVDSVYENVKTIEECKEKCLNSPYRCHSFDFGDPTNSVCRTSHLDKNSLSHIENPYIEISGATTYELLSCYNVTILCRSREMVAKVRTTKVFDGKIYAKSKPNICVNDISNSLEFEIKMKYNDVECDVKQQSKGQFTNDIVIQHHDMIVTTQDLLLNVHCKYDLSNKSISNNLNIAVDGDVDTTGHHSETVQRTVSSPNVTMRITDLFRSDIGSAQVGDPLLIRFLILEENSPYEIFVRDLVAIDGSDQSEIVLIDSLGCPTDSLIMGAMDKADGNGQILEAKFDAFKFPTSDLVQFRALVAPCLSACEPIKCSISGINGRTSEVNSYGRRRKKREADEVLVVQSLSVSDKFGFQRSQRKDPNEEHSSDESIDKKVIEINSCRNIFGISLIVFTFILAQTILIITFACLWSAKRRDKVPSNREWPQSQLISPDNYNPGFSNELVYSTRKHF